MTAAMDGARDRGAPPSRSALSRLVDGWRRRRDRILTNRAFLDWSLRFPLTRPVARARTRALFDLCAGFVYSQILLASVRLGLFERLAESPDTLEGLAERLRLSPDAMRHLLDGATGVGLVERRGDRYGLGPLGAAVVAAPGLAEMIEHHALLYADLADPVALLRNGSDSRLADYWSYAARTGPASLGTDETGSYTRLMSASQAMVAAEVVAAVPFARHRCLLDVGGGDGTFLATVAAAAPSLRLVLFDLPVVAAAATRRFESAGLSDRATAVGGDFHADALPAGADIVTLVRILHDHDDDAVRRLLRAVRLALPPGGKVIVAEPMLDVGGAQSVGAYFAFYLLAMGQGRPRSPADIRRLLADAGFARTRSIPSRSPVITAIVEGN